MSRELHDETLQGESGVAIYRLADPRQLINARYIGQTRNPRGRFMQHLNAAKLWMSDELPWWMATPKLRPLYQWVRALHQDEQRLPVMIVIGWVDTLAQARIAERAHIFQCLQQRLPLLNVEMQNLGRQLPLL